MWRRVASLCAWIAATSAICDNGQREVVMGYGLVEQRRTASLYQTVCLLHYLLRWQSFAHGAVFSMACKQRTVQQKSF
jgi:hypothetical protein